MTPSPECTTNTNNENDTCSDKPHSSPPHQENPATTTEGINDNRRKVIILMGDSLTQLSFSASKSGFGAHLSDMYQRRADVLNRGFAGYNTDWFLELLGTERGRRELISPDHNAVLITIFFGANDASDPVLNPRHHVPLPKYKSNLRSILRICHESYPRAKILIMTPPPVHHEGRLRFQKERWGEKATGELERTLELSAQYATGAEEVAKENGIPCINLWKLIQEEDPDNWGESFFYDGLHFSKKGNELVGNILANVISVEWGGALGVSPCEVTGHWGNSGSSCEIGGPLGPWHDEIDYRRPEKAFQEEEGDTEGPKRQKVENP